MSIETGRVFDIQRYSIHDGRGIRTIVFFKGCFLRCRWCCNPESQHPEPEVMLVNGEEKLVGRNITVADVMALVERDRPYYRRSGGGMTLSGGEFLYQHEFAKALLMEAKARGIHTAVESTAMAHFDVIKELLPYIDQFLLDIKHTDTAKHAAFTSKSNERALANAAKIASTGMTELIVRVPVIPGFNATGAEISAIARFAAGLENVTRLHLLPYHAYGAGKYEGLGREHPMGDIPCLGGEEMEALRRAAAEAAVDLDCRIGG